MKITGHCVVKNEDQWVYFAIKSVLDFVEELLVFDTGSTDKTVEIIKLINSSKIKFEKKGSVDRKGLVKLRQEQINRTKTDWFLILDGDEIWPKYQIEKLIKTAEKSPTNTVATFNRVRNCIGDIFHYLPESAGDYHIKNIKGNLNTRLIRKTADLTIDGEYPLEYYKDKNGSIQDQEDNLIFADCYLLHTSFLKRSSIDSSKVSGSFGRSRAWQKGIESKKEELPEVFYEKRPLLVPDPFRKRGLRYEVGAFFLDPLVKIRRKI